MSAETRTLIFHCVLCLSAAAVLITLLLSVKSYYEETEKRLIESGHTWSDRGWHKPAAPSGQATK